MRPWTHTIVRRHRFMGSARVPCRLTSRFVVCEHGERYSRLYHGQRTGPYPRGGHDVSVDLNTLQEVPDGE